jgi:branched-chain amino acid aminotransferase
MKVYLNGEFVPKEQACISVFDHGLLYGDGIFEGIRLYEGCVFKLDQHLERLELSAKAILLDIPISRTELAKAVCETCRQNNLVSGYIRLLVTRGVGHLGLSPKGCDRPTVVIIADNIQLYPKEYYEKGLKIITVPTRRISPAALPPMVKSLNYLNNILAKMEAQQAGYLEAIMLNDEGYVAECTGDNIFLVYKGRIITTPSSSGALRGITRDVAISIADELGLPMDANNITRYDVWNAEECFLTGTAAEIIPVVEVDGRCVGDGHPGPVTKSFMEHFRAKVSLEGTMI